MKERIEKEPRRFIAQEVIDFQDMDIIEDRKACSEKSGSAGICSVRRKNKGVGQRPDAFFEKRGFVCRQFIAGRRI